LTPLLPLPETISIYNAMSAGARDQPRPGSFPHKREEPGNEVGVEEGCSTSLCIAHEKKIEILSI
jgi:hypothetical protein